MVYSEFLIDQEFKEHTFRPGVTDKDSFNVSRNANQHSLNYIQAVRGPSQKSNFIASFMNANEDQDAY